MELLRRNLKDGKTLILQFTESGFYDGEVKDRWGLVEHGITCSTLNEFYKWVYELEQIGEIKDD